MCVCVVGAVGAKGAKTFVLYGVVPRQVPWVPRMCASIFEFVCVVFCVYGGCGGENHHKSTLPL